MKYLFILLILSNEGNEIGRREHQTYNSCLQDYVEINSEIFFYDEKKKLQQIIPIRAECQILVELEGGQTIEIFENEMFNDI